VIGHGAFFDSADKARGAVPRQSTATGSGEQQAFIAVCFWLPLMDLRGHRPRDQPFFLRPGAP